MCTMLSEGRVKEAESEACQQYLYATLYESLSLIAHNTTSLQYYRP